MELVNASLSTSPLRGKCLSVNEALVKLVPSESSRKVLSTFCLMGKVVAPMAVSEANVVEFVAKAWKFPVTVVALSEGPTFTNCFELSFAREEDRCWALDHGPWRKNRECYYVHLQEDNPSSWGKYLKILIEIDIKNPLFSGCFFDLDTGVRKWLQFKYEQIGIFCYYCGCLGHQRRGCKLSSPIMVTSESGIPFPLYGSWLSTSSSYLDVFSSANSFLPCRDHPGFALYAPFRRPLKAAGNVHSDGGYGKPVSNASRGSRRGRMLTRRGASISGNGQRAVWISKPKPAGDGTPVAILGIEVGFEDEANGKAPAGLPGIVSPIPVPTKDRLLITVPHLNNVIEDENNPLVGRTLAVSLQNGGSVSPSGPGALGPSGNGPANLNVKANVCSDLAVDVKRGTNGLLIGGPSDVNGPVGEKISVVGDGLPFSIGPINAHEPNISNGLKFNEASLLKCGKDINTTSSGKEAEKNIEEKKALSQFFKAQEELLHDLKHFGKLDLYEIKSLGGDIGVPPSSETNERTTPFKKRKFESSASLSSRPHKLVRTYHGVVRDFAWDTKKRIHETRAEVDDLSEEPSEEPSGESSNCNFGVNRDHLIGSFVIEESGSSLSVHPSNLVEENVKSPPQAP
uniref:CCHC-type domain-containing protein n=1 Tax=Cannabis sativa TaxID=3483 RepID=A0A803PAN9_CANSA